MHQLLQELIHLTIGPSKIESTRSTPLELTPKQSNMTTYYNSSQVNTPLDCHNLRRSLKACKHGGKSLQSWSMTLQSRSEKPPTMEQMPSITNRDPPTKEMNKRETMKTYSLGRPLIKQGKCTDLRIEADNHVDAGIMPMPTLS
ncbi:hypothetical protein TIFTF001_025358 [Ficus carica]|uniref:Uncharacterized protein n=1 Tax=Ficus carica TaxID=3494 RepID=A0AA88APT5_FICCA|nr:hypothetical protein TIFTF001_025358 [Ficus carica]